MVGPNRFLRSATSHLGHLKDVLKAQRILALVILAVKTIWREVGLLTCFQGNVSDVDEVTPESAIKFYTYEII